MVLRTLRQAFLIFKTLKTNSLTLIQQIFGINEAKDFFYHVIKKNVHNKIIILKNKITLAIVFQ